MSAFLKVFGPFLLGMTLGAGLLLTSSYWLEDTEALIKILVFIAGVLLTLLLVLWFVYRYFAEKLSLPEGVTVSQLIGEIVRRPKLLWDQNYRETRLGPVISQVGPTFGAWLAFTVSFGVVTLVLTNILLFATLLVQLLSADRLQSQNDLLVDQNGFLQIQARVDARVLLQEEQKRRQIYSARWSELEAFRLMPLNETATFERLHGFCDDPKLVEDCEQQVVLSDLDNGASQIILVRLAERKTIYLEGLIEAAFSDPPLTTDSSVEEVLTAMRRASNDCFGKDENTLNVMILLGAYLRLNFAVADFQSMPKQEIPPDLDEISKSLQVSEAIKIGGTLDNAVKELIFFATPKNDLTHSEFPSVFMEIEAELHTEILGVVDYCREATNQSDAVIEELTTFLENTGPDGGGLLGEN
jgi:hypothetical protein